MWAVQLCVNKIFQFFTQDDLYNGCKIVVVMFEKAEYKLAPCGTYDRLFTIDVSAKFKVT